MVSPEEPDGVELALHVADEPAQAFLLDLHQD